MELGRCLALEVSLAHWHTAVLYCSYAKLRGLWWTITENIERFLWEIKKKKVMLQKIIFVFAKVEKLFFFFLAKPFHCCCSWCSTLMICTHSKRLSTFHPSSTSSARQLSPAPFWSCSLTNQMPYQKWSEFTLSDCCVPHFLSWISRYVYMHVWVEVPVSLTELSLVGLRPGPWSPGLITVSPLLSCWSGLSLVDLLVHLALFCFPCWFI